MLSTEERIDKGRRLGVSWPLDPNKSSSTPEVEAVVVHLLTEMEASGVDVPCKPGKYRNNLKDHLRVIISNLYIAHRSDPSLYIAFSRDNNKYKRKRAKLGGFQFSAGNVRKVTRFLHEKGYITYDPGFPGSEDYNPALSKMQLTEKLLTLIEEQHQVAPSMIHRDTTHEETVILKGKRPPKPKGQKTKPPRPILKTPNNKAVHQMRQNLEAINKVIQQSEITFWEVRADELTWLNAKLSADPDKYKNPVDYTKKTLHRAFVDGKLDQGGRFYGGFWQGIPENFRERLMINGRPVKEMDYSAIHPHICYAEAGLPLPKDDPYMLDGDGTTDKARKFYKNFLLVILNSKNPEGAKGAVRKKHYDAVRKANRLGLPEPVPVVGSLTNEVLDPIIERLRERHKPIEHCFFQELGNTLQYKDSQVAEAVMLHFAERGIPCLPVHDSFIVPADHFVECWEVMRTEFKERFGQEIPVDDSGESLVKNLLKRMRREIEEGTRDPQDFEDLFVKVVSGLPDELIDKMEDPEATEAAVQKVKDIVDGDEEAGP